MEWLFNYPDTNVTSEVLRIPAYESCFALSLNRCCGYGAKVSVQNCVSSDSEPESNGGDSFALIYTIIYI